MRILILVFLLLNISLRVYALNYVQIVTEKNIEKLLDSIFENATNVTGVEATIYTAKSDEDALREFCSGYGDIVITNYYKDRTAKIDSNLHNKYSNKNKYKKTSKTKTTIKRTENK